MPKILLVTLVLSSAAGGWCYQAEGISGYAKAHKYLGDDRKEFTYTITSVMQIAKPYDLADMTDDYQDARILAQDQDSATVEIVYYPLNTNREAIGENPNWKRDYAHMTRYLAPTPTENWDEAMRADLLKELRQDGIDPDRLTDRQVVTEVSRWLNRRSRYTDAFAIWYVYYPDGRPEVFPQLRPAFYKERLAAGKTDQGMFDQEVLGKAMFYNRVHGSCTSYAVYLATVLRALGIPARIVFCVPPADANDPGQKEMLLSAIHHNGVRAIIRHGLPRGGFSNHLFNEAFVGNRWVRVNYDVVGQNTLDDSYFGLLTHILTTDSLSHVPVAETWGRRYALYPAVGPKLSSVNPYRLLQVSDRFGARARIANPPVADEELRSVTVKEAYWKAALPGAAQATLKEGDPTNPDFYIGIQEYIPHYVNQMRDFEAKAGHHFVLSSPGHPDLYATLSGMKLSNGAQYQMWGVRIDAPSRTGISPGAEYVIRPVNTNEIYTWGVKTGVVVRAGK
ncbi:MAG: transglutaminase domain-containing protein [Candidatus Sulfopaludibacter sp.]|nr:transglutaminase domain-containing protein [Candidatus Sulfopaludibacter sp.]